MAVVIGLPNGLPAYFTFVVPWRHKQLYRWGTAVPGKVIRKDTDQEEIEYAFEHPGLGILTARIDPASPDQMDLAEEGASITVLCYPNRQKPTVIYEYGNFECLSGNAVKA
jgi:hypothetical protein